MRKLVAVSTAVAALLFSACDPPDEPNGTPPEATGGERGLLTLDAGDLRLISLVREDSCDELLGWYQEQAIDSLDEPGGIDAFTSGYGFGGFRDLAFSGGDAMAVTADAAPSARSAGQESAAGGSTGALAPQAGTDFSGTNVQEEGVDEPDLVKTDGRLLVTLALGRLRVIDVAGDSAKELASIDFPAAHDLFLDGDRVVVLSTVIPQPGPAGAVEGDVANDSAIAPVPYEVRTSVTVVDISSPSAPRAGEPQVFDGSYVSARMVDGVVRLVLRSHPVLGHRMTYRYDNEGNLDQIARLRNREVIQETTIDDWKPEQVLCGEINHTPDAQTASTVTVVTLDPDEPAATTATAIAGAGETVYASRDTLYVSSTQWAGDRPSATTELHAFDIQDPKRTSYAASGSLPGTLLNQFSLSEHEGVLRVATTTEGIFSEDGNAETESESQVVTLRRDGSALQPLGSLGGLGKTERIYSVRFLGDQGYVVTFRQTDPLYVVDLSDAAKPRLMGELKIPGYSAYLHPIGEGRLLGIGQDATDEGQRLGAQLSLFDVRDPSAPKRIATHDLKAFGSSAEYDHHAFLHWARTGLTVVPVESIDTVLRRTSDAGFYQQYLPGAVAVALEGDAFVERARLRHAGATPITRSLVVGDRLLTLSDAGIMASDLTTLAEEAWLRF